MREARSVEIDPSGTIRRPMAADELDPRGRLAWVRESQQTSDTIVSSKLGFAYQMLLVLYMLATDEAYCKFLLGKEAFCTKNRLAGIFGT